MWDDKERMKIQSEEHFRSMPIARMKHFEGKHGVCSFNQGIYKLIVDHSKIVVIFKTINELSDAGWTID